MHENIMDNWLYECMGDGWVDLDLEWLICSVIADYNYTEVWDVSQCGT